MIERNDYWEKAWNSSYTSHTRNCGQSQCNDGNMFMQNWAISENYPLMSQADPSFFSAYSLANQTLLDVHVWLGTEMTWEVTNPHSKV